MGTNAKKYFEDGSIERMAFQHEKGSETPTRKGRGPVPPLATRYKGPARSAVNRPIKINHIVCALAAGRWLAPKRR